MTELEFMQEVLSELETLKGIGIGLIIMIAAAWCYFAINNKK